MSSSSATRRRRTSAVALAGQPEPVGDLGADRPARVQRRVRVLEDHLQPRRVLRPGAAAERGERRAVEDDLAGGRGDEADRGAGERRLAAARLADEADDLAAVDATGSRSRRRGRPRPGGGRRRPARESRAGSCAPPRRDREDTRGAASARRDRTAARSPRRPAARRRSGDGTRSPDGRLRGLGGRPGIAWSSARPSASGCGSASSRARVYGCRGWREQLAASGRTRRSGRRRRSTPGRRSSSGRRGRA